jgi:hypothetical protein
MKGTTDEREEQEDFEGCRIHRGAGRDVAADGMPCTNDGADAASRPGITWHGRGSAHRRLTDYDLRPAGNRLGRFAEVIAHSPLSTSVFVLKKGTIDEREERQKDP